MTILEVNKIILLAKIKSSKLASEYIVKISHGYDAKCVINKIKYIKSLIKSIQSYLDNSCESKLENGIITNKEGEIIMSQNNSLYLQSKEQKIVLGAEDQNCLTNDQICKMIRDLRSVTSTC